jgi:hypothetical protein
MARGSRTASSKRRTAQRPGAAPRAAPGDNGAGDKERPGRDARRQLFEELADLLLEPSAMLDRAHPLGLVTSLVVLQSLEWQSAALEVYRRALQSGAFDAPVEDHLRKMARGLMEAYLELVKSLPERRERLIAQHSELVEAVSEAIEELRERLSKHQADRRPPRP